MGNKNKLRKISMIIAWLIVAALVLTTLFAAVPIFGEEADSETSYGPIAETCTEEEIYAIPGETYEAEAETYASSGETYAAADTTSTSGGGTITQQLEQMEELLEYIEKNYASQVDINLLIDGAYQGIFEQLDPYSVYYPQKEDGDKFVSSATGEFYGIGVQMSNSDDGVVITSFTETSPARDAGVKEGDIITAIDGISLEGKTSSDATTLLRGNEGTSVTMQVKRGSQTLSFTIKRAPIEVSSVSYKMLDATTGYIYISNFYASTTTEFISAWAKLNENQNLQNLLVDIRDNPGGLVSSAITLANLFLDKDDKIMSYVNQDQTIYSYKADGNKIVDVPVKLLVNDGSASASEIFAGALQDNEAAVLIGAETYGKGMAQIVANLDNGAAIKLSIYYFETPDGNVIQDNGLTPSYIIYNGDNKAAKKRYLEMKTVANMDEGKKYKAGEKGLNVYAAQQRLKILGYENITLSGVLDEATQAAIKLFQRESGVYSYGALDFTTIDLLEKAYQQNVFSISEDVQLAKALQLIAENK